MQLNKKFFFGSIYSVLILFLAGSCNSDQEVTDPVTDQLELISKFKLSVPEPSGLAVDASGTVLYTVSDNTNQVYKISPDGEVIKTYGYSGNDLEGVSVYKDHKLLLAEERQKTIVVYDMSTGKAERYPVSYDNNEENSGIEGVAYNTHDGSSFILNEKNPGIMMRLRSDFTVVKTYDLSFASDYSGIFFDKDRNDLWIVSDQSKTINHCTLSGGLIKSYSVKINKVEGIALTTDKIYVVSDADAYLYVYKRPQN